ncbi:MAG: 23S rRNA (uridine(2552)-2'-O)-methyltransferase RlmE [Gammaproteobacteria bacterium]|nr:23S rRNA (uridine(2552)-2'-O)-methyltransferase RlmE [Gammaproteobacteria bacterium]MBT3488365.1 23S rRNA (uridine(2552)-2'-O)-methyltransferase RlmE [Gammaproteobacteria bacterium]MBT3719444.1 23S rRNA (uridine(2552)-2'-O)-methyltransferase RlmE [Gammaproteobacteria bacterium]MBT3845601.1 23S rRNA (uridine(2552)-2'-O)-methyltransferase RlmE [Gammaproteobacteria bacterium]MBT3894131.1 23S rRNA (uridine(2552)-2'-O)-methyltransferase RlmE [Gammaproteobacteria bacterium]
MAKSKSSGRWLQEHFNDEYVKRSQVDGYRSRAAYKLIEINEKDHLLRPGLRIVDLGAAPGGWTQVAAQKVGKSGVVVAMDILDMDPVVGATFLRGDFREESVLEQLLTLLGGEPLDLVLSDMAPNMSGMSAVDIPKAMFLVELAHDFARQTLKPGGDLLMKVFQGDGFDQLLQGLRHDFSTVLTRKPKASRGRSREVYLLARKYRGS